MLKLLLRLDRIVSLTARTVSVVSLALIFILFILNVFVRFVPVYNFTQTDDWIQFLLVWMIFPGAMELVRMRGHFVVDALTERLAEKRLGALCHLVATLIEFTTYVIICWYGWVWVLRAQATFQSIPWLQVRWAYAAIPVSAFFMSVYGFVHVVKAVKELRKPKRTFHEIPLSEDRVSD